MDRMLFKSRHHMSATSRNVLPFLSERGAIKPDSWRGDLRFAVTWATNHSECKLDPFADGSVYSLATICIIERQQPPAVKSAKGHVHSVSERLNRLPTISSGRPTAKAVESFSLLNSHLKAADCKCEWKGPGIIGSISTVEKYIGVCSSRFVELKIYDNARNRISATDGNGHKTQYQYDARKRPTITPYPDQTAKTNSYDGPGNLTSVTIRPETLCSATMTQPTSL